MLVEMGTIMIHIYHSVLQFSLAPLVFLYFGSHSRIVICRCTNRFQDTMLYTAAVATAAATSKFDLSCRPPRLASVYGKHARRPHEYHVRGLSEAVYT